MTNMETKKCVKCLQIKPLTEFRLVNYKRRNKDGSIYKHLYRKNTCNSCLAIFLKEYRKNKYKEDPNYFKNRNKKEWLKSRDRILFLKRQRTIKLRFKAIDLLGGKCNNPFNLPHPNWCHNYEILQIDHIIPLNILNGKRIFNDGGYNDVIKNPEEYQTLCSNCHLMKSNKESREYWEMKRNGLS